MTIEIGALEQVYAKIETTYAASAGSGGESLSATDGIRHLELSLTAKNNREPSPEKRGTPDVQRSLPRRISQAFNLSSIMWEPSGTLGTISNVGKFLEAGFGSKHAITAGLASTVSASPTPTTTTFSLVSTTGLQAGDLVIVTTSNGREVGKVLSVVSLAVTLTTALSAAPETGAAVVSGITYTLTNNITQSLAIYKYLNAGGFAQAVYGAVVDQIQATFDGTKEVLLAIQGPAGRYADDNTVSNSPTEAPPQTKPGSHTTVGNPASGMVGTFLLDGTVVPVINVQISLQNALELRNKEVGTRYASGIAGRTAMRAVPVKAQIYLEASNLLAMQKAVRSGVTAVTGVLRLVIGDTNGSMLAAFCPAVQFEIPEIGNEVGPKELTLDGMAYASSGNDQVSFMEA